MDRANLLTMHSEITGAARTILERKNQAYGGSDIFGNLNFVETLFPGVTCEQGILLRVGDKLARLSNILTNKAVESADEKVLDSLLDIINYCVLLHARRESRAAPPPAARRAEGNGGERREG